MNDVERREGTLQTGSDDITHSGFSNVCSVALNKKKTGQQLMGMSQDLKGCGQK